MSNGARYALGFAGRELLRSKAKLGLAAGRTGAGLGIGSFLPHLSERRSGSFELLALLALLLSGLHFN